MQTSDEDLEFLKYARDVMTDGIADILSKLSVKATETTDNPVRQAAFVGASVQSLISMTVLGAIAACPEILDDLTFASDKWKEAITTGITLAMVEGSKKG